MQRDERRRLRKEKEELEKLQAAADAAAAGNDAEGDGEETQAGAVPDTDEASRDKEDERANQVFTADEDVLEQTNMGQDRKEKKLEDKQINQGRSEL